MLNEKLIMDQFKIIWDFKNQIVEDLEKKELDWIFIDDYMWMNLRLTKFNNELTLNEENLFNDLQNVIDFTCKEIDLDLFDLIDYEFQKIDQ